MSSRQIKLVSSCVWIFVRVRNDYWPWGRAISSQNSTWMYFWMKQWANYIEKFHSNCASTDTQHTLSMNRELSINFSNSTNWQLIKIWCDCLVWFSHTHAHDQMEINGSISRLKSRHRLLMWSFTRVTLLKNNITCNIYYASNAAEKHIVSMENPRPRKQIAKKVSAKKKHLNICDASFKCFQYLHFSEEKFLHFCVFISFPLRYFISSRKINVVENWP